MCESAHQMNNVQWMTVFGPIQQPGQDFSPHCYWRLHMHFLQHSVESTVDLMVQFKFIKTE